ncbi:MAG: MFS transporter, partial [Lentisphaeria bacterium]|nr:MFS transporter [Lentisphaeria bacterium]
RSIRWRIPRFGVIWYLMVLFICLGLAREFDNPFLPQLVMEIMDHSPDALSWSGWISGFCSLAGIVSGLLLGFLAGRLPFIRVLVAAIVIAAVLRIVQSMSHHVAGLLVERSLMILAIGGVEPLFQAWLAGATPEREHGSYFGWAACAKAVGWISGAYFGGIVAGWFGTVRYVFFGSGLLFLLLVPLIVATARIVPPKIARKKRV